MAKLSELVDYLDLELRTADVPDYDAAMNGLQLENDGRVSRIAAAVDFSGRTVAGAIAASADLLIVHHGMFWGGLQRVTGPAYQRLRSAITGNLAVYASHIPLDLHPTFGNNALLARELDLIPDAGFGRYRDVFVGVAGSCDLSTNVILDRVRAFSRQYDGETVCTSFAADRRTRRWAIVTGAGASSETLAESLERGVDTLIVGEGAHHTAVAAVEHDIVVMYAGHYATETLGVRALAEHLSDRFELPWTFVSAPTGL